jgi:hypothetical protein
MRASSASLTAQLNALATSFSSLCTFNTCPSTTAAGTSVPFLRIRGTSEVSRTPVLFTGGVHAREWTPPDALCSFAANLLSGAAAAADFPYPVFSQPQPGGAAPIDFPAFNVPIALIQAILDGVELLIAPIINPEGRDFSLIGPFATTPNKFWRKSRRPLGIASCMVGVPPLDMSFGVDLNRNNDIIWDFDGTFFNAATAATFQNATAPCTASPNDPGTFRGPAAASEAETQNLNFLQNQVLHHIDVHMFGRQIEFPWGFATNQTTDTTRNFMNPTLDHLRDASYQEFIPTSLQTRLMDTGNFMRDAVSRTASTDPRAAGERRLQSDYTVSQSFRSARIAGACDDFFFSRQFTPVPPPSIEITTTPPEKLAFTVECGDASEHAFWVSAAEHPKIEREVHAALWGFLAKILFPSRGPSSSWPFT